MSDDKKDTAPARTRLQMRQEATLRDLVKRQANAEAYIKLHTDKLAEKLAPYQVEHEMVTRMIDEFKAANPELTLVVSTPAADDGKQPGAVNDDPDALSRAYTRGA